MKKTILFGLALLTFASSAWALTNQERLIVRAVLLQVNQVDCPGNNSAEIRYNKEDIANTIQYATSVQINNSGAQPVLTFTRDNTTASVTSDASLTIVQSIRYEAYQTRSVPGGTLIAPTFTPERYLATTFECTRRN